MQCSLLGIEGNWMSIFYSFSGGIEPSLTKWRRWCRANMMLFKSAPLFHRLSVAEVQNNNGTVWRRIEILVSGEKEHQNWTALTWLCGSGKRYVAAVQHWPGVGGWMIEEAPLATDWAVLQGRKRYIYYPNTCSWINQAARCGINGELGADVHISMHLSIMIHHILSCYIYVCHVPMHKTPHVF